jgi:C-terminal processing protease CtpA/Prc
MRLNDEVTMKDLFIALCLLVCASSCTVNKGFSPTKKYSPEELQEDYKLFRDVLEESHPSLYWYAPKDSVDRAFAIGASKLNDSLPEYKFRYVLSYVLAQIHCGHTSVRASKQATRYSDRTRIPMFPLNIKAWQDTVVVTSTLSRKDSNLVRGVLLKSIDGRPISEVMDSMFMHLSADGYNTTHKYQSLSNSGVFRSMYASIYGVKSKTPIEYIDTTGVLRMSDISLGSLITDTAQLRQLIQRQQQQTKKERKKEARQSMRNMRIDTATNTAVLEVNTFATGNKLRGFFKSSFKKMRKDHINNLVVDMRGNGGGSVVLSNLLTKYISEKPFKIADSLYAVANKSRYKEYEENYFLNRLFFIFLARKKKDGHYHFSHFEGRYFKPKKKNHFEGTTYIVIGGNTFSAASLFTKALITQDDVIVVGEETGGGAYGNTAWLIPDITLPNTKVRFRLPLFRLVIDKDAERGRGVRPEVEVDPTVRAIRHNEDYKMKKVMELIRENKK